MALKKRKISGLAKIETGYELGSGKLLAVKVVRHEVLDNFLVIRAERRLVDEKGKTVSELPEMRRSISKDGLAKGTATIEAVVEDFRWKAAEQADAQAVAEVAWEKIPEEDG